jgi:Arc/MetJ family transcription regulator
MRTNIDIDDDLLAKAMAATNTTTKKAAVEASLRLAVQLKAQAGIRDLFGKAVWRGHDDDWFASDEEILQKRREEEQAAESSHVLPPAPEQPALAGESR